MGDDQAHTNGTDPVENGVNGTEDVEMKEDSPTNGHRQHKDGDGDEEMTVVVPAAKDAKESGRDQEGDVAMDGTEGEEKSVDEVDPKVKAITGMIMSFLFQRHAIRIVLDAESY